MGSILLCTDEPILAEGLARILPDSSGLNLVSYCNRMDLLSEQIRLHRPDVLLVDLSEGFTFSVLHTLQAEASRTKIVLWVNSIPTELALQAMGFGIRGILSKTATIESLLRCLCSVDDGELWFEKNLTDSIMSAGRYSLTRREGQLVSLLAQGLKNRDIAATLQISEGTVKVYLSKLFHKLGVKDRLELALFGIRNLTPAGDGPRNSRGTPWQTPRSFFVERPAPRIEHGS
ncbi:MAG TPA: response regulator transcription factor [Bryobacteraceae bacterium]|jgi:DNA-binding NarL/FixJ family response regulator|nr:response regulator transcription factor [Bryobacteraceae bacterium]